MQYAILKQTRIASALAAGIWTGSCAVRRATNDAMPQGVTQGCEIEILRSSIIFAIKKTCAILFRDVSNYVYTSSTIFDDFLWYLRSLKFKSHKLW